MYYNAVKFDTLGGMLARLKACDESGRDDILISCASELDKPFLERVYGWVYGTRFPISSPRVLNHLRKVRYFEAMALDDAEIAEYIDCISRAKANENTIDTCARVYGSINAYNHDTAQLFLDILDNSFGGVDKGTFGRVLGIKN